MYWSLASLASKSSTEHPEGSGFPNSSHSRWMKTGNSELIIINVGFFLNHKEAVT